MTTIKIDEKVWEEFKRTVNSRYGGSRKLSKIVEETHKQLQRRRDATDFSEGLGVEVT